MVARVRESLLAAQIDPQRDPDRASQIARSEVRWHNDLALARGERTIDDEVDYVRDILAQISGLGPLQAYLDDPEVEALWINAPDRILTRGQVTVFGDFEQPRCPEWGTVLRDARVGFESVGCAATFPRAWSAHL